MKTSKKLEIHAGKFWYYEVSDLGSFGTVMSVTLEVLVYLVICETWEVLVLRVSICKNYYYNAGKFSIVCCSCTLSVGKK
jgi:hypothetical protein